MCQDILNYLLISNFCHGDWAVMFLAGFGIVKYLFSKVIILDVWIVKIFVLTSCDHIWINLLKWFLFLLDIR